jgi:hypothetical protein
MRTLQDKVCFLMSACQREDLGTLVTVSLKCVACHAVWTAPGELGVSVHKAYCGDLEVSLTPGHASEQSHKLTPGCFCTRCYVTSRSIVQVLNVLLSRAAAFLPRPSGSLPSFVDDRGVLIPNKGRVS